MSGFSLGTVQKAGIDLSGWVLGAGCFIHMSGGWAEWFEGWDYYQNAYTWPLHVAWAVAAGSGRKHLETDCSTRLRQKLQGFFLTRLWSHAVTPPLHSFDYKWVTKAGLGSRGGKLNSTSWWGKSKVILRKAVWNGRLCCGPLLENEICYIDLYVLHGIFSV